ncbi:hypothetical protein [Cryobacterium ruanii]|uniref:Uncharacterized protein n=1 Tax=Cryobacterium ruanii TaxID=1259197 RepID=A0A4R9APD2_9MICO|nr:hypothetical protein [Cryobacterium ruanii]TFD66879.1 hypothetical protein E3T47_06875 [Cryobacterium ruanii]
MPRHQPADDLRDPRCGLVQQQRFEQPVRTVLVCADYYDPRAVPREPIGAALDDALVHLMDQ